MTTKAVPRSRRGSLAAAALAAAFLAACGASTGASSVSRSAVTGMALADGPISGSVTLADASTPARQRTATTRADGSFSIDLDGLTPPYTLKVEPASGARKLYAVAESSENLDVTPISDLAYAYAAGEGSEEALLQNGGIQKRVATNQARAVLTDYAAAIAPLLARYGITDLSTDKLAVRTLLQDVTVTRASGTVTIANKRTGGVIHRGPMSDPGSGTFDPGQLPGGRGGNASSSGAASSSGGTSGGTSNLPANHPTIPSGATCTSCHSGGQSGGPPGGASSGGGAPGSSSGGASSSGGTQTLPANHPPVPSGSACSSCHGGSNGGGASSGGFPPPPPPGSSSSGGTSSSGGFPPPPPGSSSSSGGFPPPPPGSSSSGGSSSSSGGTTSGGTACGYGSNTAALAVLSGSKSESGSSYSAASADESGVCVANAGATLTLTSATITTTGSTSSQDNSSFYGQNAAALAYTGATLNLTGGSITSTGAGANGVFAYGTGTAKVSGTVIEAKGQGGHGIMTAGGGTLVATNVTATTWAQNGSVIATDRGTGNKITVSGGKFVAYGLRSAGVYSTGDITVSDAVLTANAAEGVVIEGKNSATLNNCTVTSANASEKRGMFVYQSFSGDAAVGHGALTLNGGSYTWSSTDPTSAAFYSTNTTGTITLDGVKLTNPVGYLLHAEASSWGTGGSNGAGVTFVARNETLSGDIVVDALSTVAASFTSSSSYTGAINAARTGRAVSVALDASSRWTATATSYVHTLSGVVLSGASVSNIAGSSSASVCYATSFTDASGTVHTSGTYALQGGGSLKPCS